MESYSQAGFGRFFSAGHRHLELHAATVQCSSLDRHCHCCCGGAWVGDRGQKSIPDRPELKRLPRRIVVCFLDFRLLYLIGFADRRTLQIAAQKNLVGGCVRAVRGLHSCVQFDLLSARNDSDDIHLSRILAPVLDGTRSDRSRVDLGSCLVDDGSGVALFI